MTETYGVSVGGSRQEPSSASSRASGLRAQVSKTAARRQPKRLLGLNDEVSFEELADMEVTQVLPTTFEVPKLSLTLQEALCPTATIHKGERKVLLVFLRNFA